MKVALLIALFALACFAQPPDLTYFETVREQDGIVSLYNSKTITGTYQAVEFDALITQYRIVDDQRYLNPYFYLLVRVRASCLDHWFSVVRSEKVVGDKVTKESPPKPKLEKAEKGSDVYRVIDIVCEKKFGLLT